jgi:hypothetical protein
MIQKQSNNHHSGIAHNHQEQGVAGLEFNKEYTPVNSDFYCDVLRRLRENVRRKRLALWHNHDWLLHHDNVLTHMSLKITESVTNNNMVIVLHPPYLPELYHFVSQIKNETEGMMF